MLEKSNPSGEREREREERERERNAVNSGHLVPCSTPKPLGPIGGYGSKLSNLGIRSMYASMTNFFTLYLSKPGQGNTDLATNLHIGRYSLQTD